MKLSVRHVTFVALVLAFASAGAVRVAAQPVAPAAAPFNGAISGTVRDVRKRPVSGAAVDVIGGDKRSTVITAGDGTFRLAVPPGLYDVVVRKGGFQSAEDPAVTVLSGGPTPSASRSLKPPPRICA
jgi:hypothetical protein